MRVREGRRGRERDGARHHDQDPLELCANDKPSDAGAAFARFPRSLATRPGSTMRP
jgi:hypothetical protein